MSMINNKFSNFVRIFAFSNVHFFFEFFFFFKIFDFYFFARVCCLISLIFLQIDRRNIDFYLITSILYSFLCFLSCFVRFFVVCLVFCSVWSFVILFSILFDFLLSCLVLSCRVFLWLVRFLFRIKNSVNLEYLSRFFEN